MNESWGILLKDPDGFGPPIIHSCRYDDWLPKYDNGFMRLNLNCQVMCPRGHGLRNQS